MIRRAKYVYGSMIILLMPMINRPDKTVFSPVPSFYSIEAKQSKALNKRKS